MTTTTTNPIAKTTDLRAYPGWVVREYADGTFDCAERNGVAVSPAHETFADAVAFARNGGAER